MADGDLGVTKVRNLNLAGTTATAGNIAIFLYRIIDFCPNNFYTGRGVQYDFDSFLGGGGLCPVWPETGCVSVKHAQSSAGQYTAVSLRLIEDDA